MPATSISFSPSLLPSPPPPSSYSRTKSLSPFLRNPRQTLISGPQPKSGWRNGTITLGNPSKGRVVLRTAVSYLPSSDNSPGDAAAAAPSPAKVDSADPKFVPRRSGSSGRVNLDPFRGKSGSVSFCGLTHQLMERRSLVSAPFEEGTGSFIWVAGPLALISSLLVPQIFLGTAIDAAFKDPILAEIVASFFSEVIFYAGLAAFLCVTDHVQRPYLDFSPKQWSLITGLRGYLSSAFFTMGFKVFAPLLAAYVVWPIIGLPALVAVAPFLVGCVAQFVFEMQLSRHGSSCWPLLPIIFEVYRLYQLNKAAHFLEGLMFSMRGSAVTPESLERSGALFSMLTGFQILGVVCLWSLTTFLLRLFPSRPVAENY